jgi:hypothetical protein
MQKGTWQWGQTTKGGVCGNMRAFIWPSERYCAPRVLPEASVLRENKPSHEPQR